MILIVFFDSKGLIHHEFVSTGTTVSVESYEGVLKWLLQRIRRFHPQLYQGGQWKLLRDNARPHTVIRVRHVLAARKVTVLEPSISPDMAPADFFLFSCLKVVLKAYAFPTLRRSNNVLQLCFEPYRKKRFLAVSSSCKTNVKSVL
ncbi:hypothetical protein AVEN_231875-1 [Araneus ventricosus]|uniref:Tc1-like transposase DDE domain-containing protein n=1 Tax=Araneus ventricosus TaxID=182803 RepID=A0A4Y2LTB7_ARAVE|nr:hypothetical protein AVEN_231875-1 [Araneus ventricosus]